ncbi:LON peptidase substrate-binding domain-containing protein [Frankia sp. AgKG'84/4]|uniref:LON peptidase substrate-binding domain-containing protein n=1 Tax=Frankia sp. AgKG'84/4 TaxID=573490 RepID=UPI00200BBBEE|nr:LON peptidase substrate-binding domain-containing protein [Frankia sp. AgKG'84/4]MCL9796464.1 LON peptidase substrate-binding domain-containing protein [Frankia sp. AgKG'84/4]
MSTQLPLFPLGTVLLPGLVLPLEIFEERYRTLVRQLLTQSADEVRQFGVVAIRRGRETGPALPALHEVGCTAVVRRVQEHPDGRFSLITVGGQRFRVGELDQRGAPYLLGEVEFLPDELGDADAARAAVEPVQRLMRTYAQRLAATGTVQISLPDLPDDPIALSYVVAAAAVTDLTERQGLLAAADAASRLGAERAFLRREVGLLGKITTIGSSELRRVDPSPN